MTTSGDIGVGVGSQMDRTQQTIHCWDPLARRMVCGAPGQIGSTKHVGAVTCSTCLELLGKPSRPMFSAVR